jgi:hypothetical protein
MRKVLQVLISGAVVSTAMGAAAHAQGASATGTGSGSVTIVQPITISAGSGLVFGRLSKPTAAGTVTINPTNGNQTLSGGAAKVGTQTTTAASFVVTGDGAETFSIHPDATFSMTSTTSGATAINVTTSASASTGSLSGATGGTGTAPFTVGGTMSLAAAQVAGSYSGSFHVVVSYN